MMDLKERILKEMVIESELYEIRSILEKINENKTIIDSDRSVKILDISQGILMYCKRCDSIEPFEVRNYHKNFLWFYCGECGQPEMKLEIIMNRGNPK